MTLVYLDICIAEKDIGRVVVQLFEDDAPLASENFRKLCQDKEYQNTFMHKIIKTFIIQCGDTSVKDEGENALKYPALPLGLNGNGKSIYNNQYFQDENLIDIDKPFLLCMSNFGEKNHKKSQFFITLDKAIHLNGKHTVFGIVKYGKSIIREVENVEVYSNKQSDSNAWVPTTKVVINDCGIWEEGDPLPNHIACTDQIGGDIYEEYPDDNDIEGLDFENAEQSYKVTSIIKESATLLLKQKRYDESLLKFRKALRYCNELLPDDESNKEMFDKFQELKKTIYLNMSLVALNKQDYNQCINYCGFLLQMESVKLSDVQASKIFYRLGKSYHMLKKYDIALETLKKGAMIAPNDPSIKHELETVSKIIQDTKKEEKAKFAKFFS